MFAKRWRQKKAIKNHFPNIHELKILEISCHPMLKISSRVISWYFIKLVLKMKPQKCGKVLRQASFQSAVDRFPFWHVVFSKSSVRWWLHSIKANQPLQETFLPRKASLFGTARVSSNLQRIILIESQSTTKLFCLKIRNYLDAGEVFHEMDRGKEFCLIKPNENSTILNVVSKW